MDHAILYGKPFGIPLVFNLFGCRKDFSSTFKIMYQEIQGLKAEKVTVEISKK
jgi:hypothetical protein